MTNEMVLAEAHNIEDVCREAGSQDVTSVQLMHALNLLLLIASYADWRTQGQPPPCAKP